MNYLFTLYPLHYYNAPPSSSYKITEIGKVRGLEACALVMSSLLVASNRPPNLVILEWVCERLFVRITMADLNLVSDFLSVQSDESCSVLFLARKRVRGLPF